MPQPTKHELEARRAKLIAKRKAAAAKRQRLRKRIQKISERAHHLAHRIKHYHKPEPLPNRMWDSVNLAGIPGAASHQAVGSYAAGPYANYTQAKQTFPHAKHVAIVPQASEDIPLDADAGILDIEPSDAVPSQYPAWYKRQRARGFKKPLGSYSSLSEYPGIQEQPGDVRWLANPTGSIHSVNGYDACQCIWQGQYDESTVERSFWT